MPHVVIEQGRAPADMAYAAISRVFTEDPAELSVLIKVNTGFKGPAASGLCTHPETVRGLIRFFKDRHTKKIYVGDSSIVGTDSVEALKAAGIWDVCAQEGVECLNLDDSGMVEKEIPNHAIISRLKLSRLPFAVDRIISAAVMKTHMYATVTLSIKNMKGCLFQRDKTRLHRIKEAPPDIKKGKCLDYGICDLMKLIYPDYAVIDAVVAMEGFGPSGGNPVEMGLVMAGDDALATDLVAVQLMGMEPDAVPHLNLVREDRGFDPETTIVEPADWRKYARRFMLASEHDLGLSYPNPKINEKGACSACHAAMVQFFRYHHQEFEDFPPVTLFFGMDHDPSEFKVAECHGERVVLIGNCTAKFRHGDRPFCKGCPPVPSQIARTIHENQTMDD